MRVVSLVVGLGLLAALAAPGCMAQQHPAAVQLSCTENDPLTYIALDIVREAYRRIGVNAEGVCMPAERAVTSLNAGEYYGDVIHIAGVDAAYPNLVRVPIPVISFDALAFTAGRELPPLRTWSDLQPYRVCIRRGIKAIERKTEGLHQVTQVNQYSNVFAMVKLGRCDVAVLPDSAWLEMEKLDVRGLRSLEPSLYSWPLYHHVHKSNAAMIPALTQALQEMQKTGYLAARQAEYNKRLQQARRRLGSE